MAYLVLRRSLLLVLKVTCFSYDTEHETFQNMMNISNLINEGGQLYPFLVIPFH